MCGGRGRRRRDEWWWYEVRVGGGGAGGEVGSGRAVFNGKRSDLDTSNLAKTESPNNMINLDPLHDAFIVTDDVGKGNLIVSLIQSFDTGSPFSRQFYESGEAGRYCSSTTHKALGKVLESVEEEERLRRAEGEGESRGKKALDFSVVSVDLVCDNGEGSFVPITKPRSKRARPPTKIRAKRKAALVALRQMRGLPDKEMIVLSSDDEAEIGDDGEVLGPPLKKHSARQMSPKVQPSK